MSWIPNLRILAFARRAVRALESMAESQAKLARLAEDEWSHKHAPARTVAASFSAFDHESASKRWEEEQSLKHGS